MARTSHDSHRYWLAPVTQELLVAVRPDGTPDIADVSAQIAAWTGHPARALIGRPVAEVFDAMLPGLAAVVEDLRDHGEPIRDYRLTFEDHAGTRHTVLLQGYRRPAGHSAAPPGIVLQFRDVPERQIAAELPAEIHSTYGMVGQSPALLRVVRKIDIYGPTEAPVLITGETGTGKELAARAIHGGSRRRQQPFVAVNCSALSAELLESELFGHERGAFTGAVRTHRGRFERAHRGTLFLDEVGEMPLPAQAKLLRVLEEGQLERVGSERTLEVDVRLITATNVPLEQAVHNKTFRLDLYHRLVVLRVHMPALRERLEDIPMLVAYYLEQFNRQYQRQVRRMTPEAVAVLQDYDWPGNIRELRNVMERIYVETVGEVIGRRALDEWVQERVLFAPGTWDLEARRARLAQRPALVPPYPADAALSRPLLPYYRDVATAIDVESRAVPGSEQPPAAPDIAPLPRQRGDLLTPERMVWAYHRAGGNMTAAARLLGIHKATLYRHMKTLGLSREDLEARRATASYLPATSHERG